MHELGRQRRVVFAAGAGVACLLLAASGSLADGAQAPSPYAGQESAPVSSLTAEQTEDLLAGRGMGLAKSAELNHYPGPRHVLDLADQLGLSPEQRAEARRLFAGMQATASGLGARLVAAEAALDQLFASGRADETALTGQVGEIARLEAELRVAHLAAHIAMRRALSDDQVALYDHLRGYRADQPQAPGEEQHLHGG